MRILNIYSKLDILGEPFSLTLNGSSSIKSWFGATLTLVFIGMVIVASVIFTRAFFDYSTPNVSETSDNFKKGLTVNLGSQKMLPFIRVLDKTQDVPDYLDSDSVENLFQFSLTVVTITQNPDGSEKEEQEYFYGIPCDELAQNKTKFSYLSEASNYEDLKDDLEYYAYCLDITNPENIRLEGNGTSIGSKIVQINIQPCSALETPGCKAFDKSLYSIELFFPSFAPDFKNPQKPVLMSIDLDNGFKVNDFSLFRTEFIRPINNLLYDEDQITTKEKLSGKFIDLETLGPKYSERVKDGLGNPIYSCDTADLGEEDCQSLYQINFVNSRKQIKFVRKYKLVTQVLSEIGGISTLLLQVFTYINMVYLFFRKEAILIGSLLPSIYSKSKPEAQTDKSQKKEEEKKWKKIQSDSVKMIDASVDLTTLIQEISSIRVLSRILLDDMQRQLILLSSIQLFRTAEKEKEEAEKAAAKSGSVHPKGLGKKQAKTDWEEAQEKERTAFQEISKRSPQDPLVQKIDEDLKKAVQGLELGFLEKQPALLNAGEKVDSGKIGNLDKSEKVRLNSFEVDDKKGLKAESWMIEDNSKVKIGGMSPGKL